MSPLLFYAAARGGDGIGESGRKPRMIREPLPLQQSCNHGGQVMTAERKEQLKRLRDLATTYKNVVILVGIQWVVALGSNPRSTNPNAATGDPGPRGVLLLVALALAVVLAVYGYRLARLLERSLPVLYAIGMFIPLVNLIVLLILSRASAAVCRRHGIGVGFFGPDRRDLQKLEAAARDSAQ